MKLRIHENSLRIRVTRPELEALRHDRSIAHELIIGADSRLEYRLELTESGALRAELSGSRITVRVPESMALSWFDESAVSIEGSQQIGENAQLQLLVEKDFQCLIPRENEDQSEYFENPASTGE